MLALRQERSRSWTSITLLSLIVGVVASISLFASVTVAQETDADVVAETKYWQEVFQGKRILEMELRFTARAWQAMQPAAEQRRPGGFPKGDQTEFSYARASMTIDAKRLDDVGVRFKGNSSYRSSQRGFKRPFKIDTNRFVKGLKWNGRTKLNLSNSFKDASYLREKLGYEIFQAAGLPVPGVGWIHLTLTVEGQVTKRDLGLYVLVEQVDDDWIERKLGAKSASTVLMKPEGFAEWPYLGENLQAYDRYSIKEGEKNTKLMKRFAAFLRLLNESEAAEFSRQADQYLDLENWAQYLAANTLLVNLDSMVAMTHNYYLLVDSADGLIKILPWDLNECFGLFTLGAAPHDLVRWDIRRPWVMESKLLIRLFDMPEFRKRYEAAIGELMKSAFQPAVINRRIAELQPRLEAVLRENGHSDELRSMRASIEATQASGESFRGSAIGLKYFIKQRVASVQGQLAGSEEGVKLQQRRRGGPPFGPPPGMDRERPMIPGIQVIEILDADRNGVLSAEEIKQAASRLKKLDRNGDGKLSPMEYEFGIRPRGERPGFPPRPR